MNKPIDPPPPCLLQSKSEVWGCRTKGHRGIGMSNSLLKIRLTRGRVNYKNLVKLYDI